MNACSSPFSFPHVGVTRTAPPLPETVAAEGWALDHNCVQVGLRCCSCTVYKHRLCSNKANCEQMACGECSAAQRAAADQTTHRPAATNLQPAVPNNLQVGRGRAAYHKAQRLLQHWRHFDLGWASVNAPPVKQGAPVVVTARTLLCWSCNPLRISFVEEGALRPGQLQPWTGAGSKATIDGRRRQRRSSSSSSSMKSGAKLATSSSGDASSSSSNDPLTRLLGALTRGAGTRAAQQQPVAAEVRPPRGRRYAFAHTTLAGHQISGEERFAVAWNQDDDSGAACSGGCLMSARKVLRPCMRLEASLAWHCGWHCRA